jgi:hypothetical protein
MSGPANISTEQFQKNTVLFGAINCAAYAIVILLLKFLHLKNVSGLIVPLDDVILCLISFYQIKRLMRQTGIPLKSLRAFSLVFFTGVWSFAFFGGFILLYSALDPDLIPLFKTNMDDKSILTPAIVIVAEGIGGSIIAALIGTMYSDRYADHEVNL